MSSSCVHHGVFTCCLLQLMRPDWPTNSCIASYVLESALTAEAGQVRVHQKDVIVLNWH